MQYKSDINGSQPLSEIGSIELVVVGLLAALMVVLAFPLFDGTKEPGIEETLPVNQ